MYRTLPYIMCTFLPQFLRGEIRMRIIHGNSNPVYDTHKNVGVLKCVPNAVSSDGRSNFFSVGEIYFEAISSEFKYQMK